MCYTCEIGTTTCDITTGDSHVKLEQPHVILPHHMSFTFECEIGTTTCDITIFNIILKCSNVLEYNELPALGGSNL
jgi:hypothetical protein